MKSQKGITLISLTVYIIAMAIVIGTVATITNYFYKNVKTVDESSLFSTEFLKFNSFFVDEINNDEISIVECKNGTDENGNVVNYVLFSNNVQYSFIEQNKGIYKNEVKICKDVENCTFTENTESGKTTLTVTFNIGDKNRDITYTL